jgi:hypothetical protein
VIFAAVTKPVGKVIVRVAIFEEIVEEAVIPFVPLLLTVKALVPLAVGTVNETDVEFPLPITVGVALPAAPE